MTSRSQAALRELHDDHAAPLWRYVCRLTGDPQRAQDIVQETLLRAWQAPVEIAGPTARAWLFTVARNLVIDDARSARRRYEHATDPLPEVSVGDATDAVFDSMIVTDALRTLSQEHRAVVVMAYFGRRSVAEIAADLAIPPGTVKSRLHYGLRALRLALQERGVTR